MSFDAKVRETFRHADNALDFTRRAIAAAESDPLLATDDIKGEAEAAEFALRRLLAHLSDCNPLLRSAH